MAFGSGTHKIRIKWTKLTSDYLKEVDVFVSMGYHKKAYGGYQGRVFLKGDSDNDASLVITDLTLEDYGKYKCEVIEGLEDDTAVVSLDLQGKYLSIMSNLEIIINHYSLFFMISGYHNDDVRNQKSIHRIFLNYFAFYSLSMIPTSIFEMYTQWLRAKSKPFAHRRNVQYNWINNIQKLPYAIQNLNPIT